MSEVKPIEVENKPLVKIAKGTADDLKSTRIQVAEVKNNQDRFPNPAADYGFS